MKNIEPSNHGAAQTRTETLRLLFADGRQHPVADALGRIALVGGLLTILTLSIYRFWMKTRQRQLIWQETRIGGDGFEYTGTPLEKLIGTMMAIVILAIWLGGANLLLSYLQLAAWQDIDSSIALTPLLLSPLIAFAVYRARRYKLLRTRWRGIRCAMDGSGLAYALRWIGWTLLQALTLGLATPFKALALEGYMARHTLYGDARFSFQPRPRAGRRLLLHLLLPWIAGLCALALLSAPSILQAAAPGDAEVNPFALMEQAAPFMLGGAALMLIVYPLFLRYRAKEIAERISGYRIAGARFESNLRWSVTLRPFLAWLGRLILLGLPVLMLMGAIVALGMGLAALIEGRSFADLSERMQEGATMFSGFTHPGAIATMLAGSYLGYSCLLLFTMWLASVVHFRRLHTFICRGTCLIGAERLGDVAQRSRADQRESEGFADALDIGGI